VRPEGSLRELYMFTLVGPLENDFLDDLLQLVTTTAEKLGAHVKRTSHVFFGTNGSSDKAKDITNKVLVCTRASLPVSTM
jgi:hypothetical protein